MQQGRFILNGQNRVLKYVDPTRISHGEILQFPKAISSHVFINASCMAVRSSCSARLQEMKLSCTESVGSPWARISRCICAHSSESARCRRNPTPEHQRGVNAGKWACTTVNMRAASRHRFSGGSDVNLRARALRALRTDPAFAMISTASLTTSRSSPSME